MIGRFKFRGNDIREDIEHRLGYDGDLLDIYASHTGALIHKWHHYLALYDRYFGARRNTAVRFLEIGVSKGGSLEVWRKFFGPDAVIYGIDIDPECARFDGMAGQVRIGSQADPDFLNRVVDEMGGVDIVLDDGSHHMDHIPVSLETLFPRLSMGGTYMIEDLHTAYWQAWGGGADVPKNFFNMVRTMIDDMHRWYTRRGLNHPALAGELGGIHIHDSVVVLDKAPAHAPTHSKVG